MNSGDGSQPMNFSDIAVLYEYLWILKMRSSKKNEKPEFLPTRREHLSGMLCHQAWLPSLSLSLPLSPRQGDIWCAPLWPSNVRKSGPSDTAKRLGCTPKSCMAFSTKTSISGTWSLDTARWTNKTWDVIIVPMKYVAMMRNDQIMGISNNMEKSWNTTIPIGYAVCPI